MKEITARKGPRTGGFEFDDITVDHILNLAKKYAIELRNDPQRNSRQIKEKVSVRSPISDKTYKIPFVFYWNAADKTTGLFLPYASGRGKEQIRIRRQKEAYQRERFRQEKVELVIGVSVVLIIVSWLYALWINSFTEGF